MPRPKLAQNTNAARLAFNHFQSHRQCVLGAGHENSNPVCCEEVVSLSYKISHCVFISNTLKLQIKYVYYFSPGILPC